MIHEKLYVTIECDGENCDKDILAATVTTKRDRYVVHQLARKAAESAGWRRIKVDGNFMDLCPLCYSKLKTEETQ